MNDLFGQPIKDEPPRFLVRRVGRRALSEKQAQIMAALDERGEITLAKATKLVGDQYHNQSRYTGMILSNMCKRGYLRRVKAGLFAKA